MSAICPRRRDHPRIRGEHDGLPLAEWRRAGSSPHTRGAPSEAADEDRERGIIPAYAGSTPEAPSTCPAPGDHPRIRGEHLPPLPRKRALNGSSPHTRGARKKDAAVARYQADHPRIRGEHVGGFLCVGVDLGSSPHTRGALWGVIGQIASSGIIPAYAGSTADGALTQMSIGGSSPHTRGAHLEIPAIPRIAAVIIPVFLYPSPTPQEEADRSMVLLTLS